MKAYNTGDLLDGSGPLSYLAILGSGSVSFEIREPFTSTWHTAYTVQDSVENKIFTCNDGFEYRVVIAGGAKFFA